MTAAASLTLAGIHGFVWIRRRTALDSLAFCILAAGTAGMAGCELWMMHLNVLEDYGTALQLYNFLRWLVTIALVVFIHFSLKAGRPWLEWTVIGTRTLGLVLNFIVSPAVYYTSLEEIRRIPFLGSVVSVVDGIPNPLTIVGQLSLLLLAAYLVDTTLRSYRLHSPNRALRVGLSSVFFVLALSLQMMLVLWGVVDAPLVASLFFLGIVIVMGIELSEDMLRAARLAETLQSREVELGRQRQLTDAVLEGAPGILFLQSREGDMVRWNSQHEKTTGLSRQETSSRKSPEFFSEADRPLFLAQCARVFEEGSAEFEAEVLSKDGSTAPHLLRLTALELQGSPHAVGLGIDISAKRAYEREAANQRQKMEQLTRVASVSELSSSLAHEINQPLAIILSNAQAAQRLLARENPDLRELQEILDDIVAADIRAADVIKRLRSILQQGVPVLEPVAASALIDQALKICLPDLKAAGIQVVRRLPKRLPLLPADRIPIEQVLLNLFKNACEAMQECRERVLTISCVTEGPVVRFSVKDTGCGLPEDTDSVFEAFQTTKLRGLGLGLTICQSIVRAHGGRLWADRNRTRGATFHFTLPLNPESL